MLEYNQITARTYIVLDGEPYEVLDSHIFRKQQRKPVNQTKAKNLITGKVMERSFHQAEKVERAEIESKKVVFIFEKRGEYWFHTQGDKSDRFSIDESIIGDQKKFIKNTMELDALVFNDQIIGIRLPIKIDLEVTEAPPNVKGNTAQGGDKKVTLETGAEVTVPMFIEAGDIIKVNTGTGEYVERVEKK